MTIYLVWPTPESLYLAATVCRDEDHQPSEVLETGQRSLADTLSRVSHRKAKEIKIFAPPVMNQDVEKGLETIIENNCMIFWYGIASPDSEKAATALKETSGLVYFEDIGQPPPEDIANYLRYRITLAFLGDTTGAFDTGQLKQAVIELAEDPARALKKENHCLKRFARLSFPAIEGQTPPMVALKKNIRRVAEAGLDTTLLFGETGAGKEAAAFFLHDFDPGRHNGDFQAINCVGLQEEFLASELFGHIKGAYTGASRERQGLVAQLNQGTLFLDELPDMPLRIQAMLLRFLESGEYSPMGSSTTHISDVKVVAGAQKDLLAERLRDGRFRKDLYYRLTGKIITIPSLREISDDIPRLIDHLVYKMDPVNPGDRNRTIRYFQNRMRELKKYPWPGNVRELANYVRRIMKLGPEEQIELGDYDPDHLFTTAPSQSYADTGMNVHPVVSVSFGAISPELTINRLRDKTSRFNSPDAIKKAYIRHVYKSLTEKGAPAELVREKLQISINTLKKHIRDAQGQD